jgi:putative membrane protein
MYLKYSSRSLAALSSALVFAFSACSKKEAGTSDTGMAATGDTGAVATMADTGMSASATPAAGLSDANIFYVLDNANMLDSAGGSIASTKGTNSEVRDFGKRMMRDHHQLRQQGQDLAKKLNITPAPPANDSSAAQKDKAMSLLNGAAKGKDFDKAYIDHEVEMHKAVLETATAAMSAAQNAELKNLIQKAAPAIQAHLDLAQSIQGKLK